MLWQREGALEYIQNLFDKCMGTQLSTFNLYIIYQMGFIRDRELEGQDATDSIEGGYCREW